MISHPPAARIVSVLRILDTSGEASRIGCRSHCAGVDATHMPGPARASRVHPISHLARPTISVAWRDR